MANNKEVDREVEEWMKDEIQNTEEINKEDKPNLNTMSIIDPVSKKDMAIAWSLEKQQEINKNLERNNELVRKGNRIKKVQIVVLLCIGIILLLMLFSGKISMIGNNIFCR